jgi:hypothetical protein
MINWKVFCEGEVMVYRGKVLVFFHRNERKKNESGKLIFGSILGTDMPRTQVQKVPSNMLGAIS